MFLWKDWINLRKITSSQVKNGHVVWSAGHSFVEGLSSKLPLIPLAPNPADLVKL